MDFTNVSEALRGLLKSRNITYKDLADKLKMSESGIKKLITSDDISFNKLNKILGLLEMTLSELLSLQSKGFPRLTEKQESFLTKHPGHFNFFLQIHHHRNNIEALKKENPKLSKARLNQYIEDLTKVGILEWNDAVLTSPLQEGFTTGDKFNEQFQKRTYDFVINSLKNEIDYKKNPWLYEGFGHFSLTQKSALELRVALQNLMEEFSKRSDREQKMYSSKDLLNCATLMVNAEAKFKDMFPI